MRLLRSYAHVAALKRIAQDRISAIDQVQPFSNALIDSYQRQHNYLRISLSEKCNLRCFYCMPDEGVELTPSAKLLSNEEVLRLAELFVKSGVRKIRLTGGEPTVRKGVLDIIAGLNSLRQHGLESIAMTSNGIALHRRLSHYIDAGLTHLNLSLDTLDPFKFELMTKRRGHDAVLKTMEAALSSEKLRTVKLNVVVVKGLNDHEILDFVALTKDAPLSVRFIEFMPFRGNKWDKSKMVPSSTLLDRITTQHHGAMRISDETNDTARSWKVPGYKGSFGFISSMSDHFCSSCNRLRITADGKIKVCLFDEKEVSLRDAMRDGGTDSDLLKIIRRAVLGKQEKHAEVEDINVITNRPMILIGGLRCDVPNRRYKKRKSLLPLSPFLQSQPVSCISTFHTTATESVESRLSHLDSSGRVNMVDVSDKSVTKRTATAIGRIYIPPIAYDLVVSDYPVDNDNAVEDGKTEAKTKALRKGDALTVAQLAAIMGSKKTHDLIPLCHPLPLTKVAVTLTPERDENVSGTHRHSIKCQATVTTEGKTGVEMEALTAVSVGLLTVWDMLKAVAGKEMVIGDIYVSEKSGGRSGDFSLSR
ncbi:molybdopterin cofactor biosynthetic protein [Moniliophthora roreri MCA 2997]|uniref:Molybdopterin cofactor biosynthetic protein n=2 Tax=Moniliophthora roreri TaxID=221103 RepID=V2XJL9_MONRO|nr:molybdopterin cofactor biosynthetic protein [Moniliophthora roreri MCA 2997]